MFPRSSMLMRRLTTTRFLARLRAPEARLMVTIAGSSCGVRPTAMASENNADSRIGRPSSELITKMPPAKTAVTLTSRIEKLRSPRWKAVSGWRSPSRRAIWPKTELEPVATTTPDPDPPRTVVPMYAAHRRPS